MEGRKLEDGPLRDTLREGKVDYRKNGRRDPEAWGWKGLCRERHRN